MPPKVVYSVSLAETKTHASTLGVPFEKLAVVAGHGRIGLEKMEKLDDTALSLSRVLELAAGEFPGETLDRIYLVLWEDGEWSLAPAKTPES